jgi:hypothetical protein
LVGCIAEEERKRSKGRRGREEGERERERERERRGASIPHFLRKMNYALSPFADRGKEN